MTLALLSDVDTQYLLELDDIFNKYVPMLPQGSCRASAISGRGKPGTSDCGGSRYPQAGTAVVCCSEGRPEARKATIPFLYETSSVRGALDSHMKTQKNLLVTRFMTSSH